TYFFTHLDIGKYTRRRKPIRRQRSKPEVDIVQRYIDCGLASDQTNHFSHPPDWPLPEETEVLSFSDIQLVEAPRRNPPVLTSSLHLPDVYNMNTSIASVNQLIRTR
ncbi:hypothetical protein L0F63_003222, partial [Massospora cicadina]